MTNRPTEQTEQKRDPQHQTGQQPREKKERDREQQREEQPTRQDKPGHSK